MKMRKWVAGAVAAVGLAAAVPGIAGAQHFPFPGSSDPQYENVVDAVVQISGAPGEGFDNQLFDYDILREALVAADLVNAVASAEDITVFAPTDFAFIRLARDLGYRGFDEAEAFAAIAEATGYVSAEEPGLLDDVLLYHVAPDGRTVAELQAAGDIATLLDGATVEVRFSRVIDADTDDFDAFITWPRDIETGNGVIQPVSQVLRPIDLP